jgi:hypothetical protein
MNIRLWRRLGRSEMTPNIAVSAMLCGVVVLLIVSPSVAQTQQVIINGGFETGDFSGWSTYNAANPWSIRTNNPHSGNYSAFNLGYLTAIGQPTLWQSFAPVPVQDISSAGYWYFDTDYFANTGFGLDALLLFSDGTAVADTLFASDPSYKLNQWVYRDLVPTLAANAGKSLVEVGFYPELHVNQYIDDVSIVIIPEPKVWLLVLLGIPLVIWAVITKRIRVG